jgi:hypothetical protein
MTTTPDYTAIIAQCARIAIRNEETHGTDPAYQFIAALHGTLRGTLNAGIGDAGTRAAFQALDALFQRVQSVTE